jgi:hypothetical protein
MKALVRLASLFVVVAFCGCASRRYAYAPSYAPSPMQMEIWKRQSEQAKRQADSIRTESDATTAAPVRIWLNLSRLRFLYEMAAKGEITSHQVKETYDRELLLATIESRRLSHEILRPNDLAPVVTGATPELPRTATHRRVVDFAPNENDFYSQRSGKSDFLQGFSAGSEAYGAGLEIALRRQQFQAQDAERRVRERYMEAQIELINQEKVTSEEMFRLLMQSQGWQLVSNVDADARIAELESLNRPKVLPQPPSVAVGQRRSGTDFRFSPRRGVAGVYLSTGSGHWIQGKTDDGDILTLEDGSVWLVDTLDRIDTALWLPISEITVVESDGRYLLINTDDGEKAHATLLHQ